MNPSVSKTLRCKEYCDRLTKKICKKKIINWKNQGIIDSLDDPTSLSWERDSIKTMR